MGWPLALAVELKSTPVDGVGAQNVESYAVPAAILSTALGLTAEGAASLLRDILRMAEPEDMESNDCEKLISAIADSTVDLGHGVRASIGQAIRDHDAASRGSDACDALERSGLKVFGNPPRLFVACDLVARKLLGDTDWKGNEDRRNSLK